MGDDQLCSVVSAIARRLWGQHGFRDSRRAYRRAVPGLARQPPAPCEPASRAGCGLYGGWLCPRLRQAWGVLYHHRSWDDQYPHRHGPGLCRLGSHAGDLHHQPPRASAHGPRPSARAARSARDGQRGLRLQSYPAVAGGVARAAGPRLRHLHLRAATAGAYRDSAGRAGNAGRRPRLPAPAAAQRAGAGAGRRAGRRQATRRRPAPVAARWWWRAPRRPGLAATGRAAAGTGCADLQRPRLAALRPPAAVGWRAVRGPWPCPVR